MLATNRQLEEEESNMCMYAWPKHGLDCFNLLKHCSNPMFAESQTRPCFGIESMCKHTYFQRTHHSKAQEAQQAHSSIHSGRTVLLCCPMPALWRYAEPNKLPRGACQLTGQHVFRADLHRSNGTTHRQGTIQHLWSATSMPGAVAIRALLCALLIQQ